MTGARSPRKQVRGYSGWPLAFPEPDRHREPAITKLLTLTMHRTYFVKGVTRKENDAVVERRKRRQLCCGCTPAIGNPAIVKSQFSSCETPRTVMKLIMTQKKMRRSSVSAFPVSRWGAKKPSSECAVSCRSTLPTGNQERPSSRLTKGRRPCSRSSNKFQISLNFRPIQSARLAEAIVRLRSSGCGEHFRLPKCILLGNGVIEQELMNVCGEEIRYAHVACGLESAWRGCWTAVLGSQSYFRHSSQIRSYVPGNRLIEIESLAYEGVIHKL